MLIFVHLTVKNVHSGQKMVKKGQNIVHVVIECPPWYMTKMRRILYVTVFLDLQNAHII